MLMRFSPSFTTQLRTGFVKLEYFPAQRFSEQLEEAVRNTDADDRVILRGRMRQIIRNAFGAACDVNVRNNPRSLTDRPTILTEVKCCLNRDFAPIDCLGPEG